MPQEITLRKPDDEPSKIAYENWQAFMLKRGYMTAWISPDGEEWVLQPYMHSGPVGWPEASPSRIINMIKARWQ